MGRPTKYDTAKAEKIATLLRSGCTRRDAAGSVGVTDDTLLNWLKRYSDFSELVASAEAFAAVKMTTILTKAADGDWRAALEWLKRRRREDWGDNEKVTHGGSFEFITAAAATADAKFAAAVARSREPAAENLRVGAGTVNGHGGQGARG